MRTLYTIGHSNHTFETFTDLLQQHEIGIVVDVRSAPYSRYSPHYNRDLLERNLSSVRYIYMGQFLGGRPNDTSVYRDHDSETARKREDYLSLVDYELVMTKSWYRNALQSLLDLLNTDLKVVIMCSEADPLDCHRHHLIARSLIVPDPSPTQMNLEVVHILRDGTLKLVTPADFVQPPQQLSLF